MKSRFTIKSKITISIAIVILFISSFSFWYINDYYHQENTPQMQQANDKATQTQDYFEFNKKSTSNTGIIFYPGGKVEAGAYNQFLDKLAQKGYHVFGLKVLFNLAILDQNKADKVILKNKQIKKWYIIGHSLGGVSGQNYANEHSDKILGVVHLGSYPLTANNAVKNIAIFGSLDKVVNRKKLENAQRTKQIIGANHSQFGNYGFQKGDSRATITSSKQQELTIKYILEFINNGVL